MQHLLARCGLTVFSLLSNPVFCPPLNAIFMNKVFLLSLISNPCRNEFFPVRYASWLKGSTERVDCLSPPMKRKGGGQGTGRSGPPLLGGSRGGDTPVNLSGRGCYCADVSVCLCLWVCLRGTTVRGETEWEPQGEEDGDQGVQERVKDFCGTSAWPADPSQDV